MSVIPLSPPSPLSRPTSPSIRVLLAAATLVVLPAARIASAPQPVTTAPRVIEIVATRYAFAPADIDVTEGETVRLLVRSGDGPHGFEIAALKVKQELARGARPVVIEFTAPGPGRFPILCSEFCGTGHGDMKGTLVVHARSEVP